MLITQKESTSIKQVVHDKMRVLADFDICEGNDRDMMNKLEKVIREHPDKDPREVLDYFCRPMIQAKANSWD